MPDIACAGRRDRPGPHQPRAAPGHQRDTLANRQERRAARGSHGQRAVRSGHRSGCPRGRRRSFACKASVRALPSRGDSVVGPSLGASDWRLLRTDRITRWISRGGPVLSVGDVSSAPLREVRIDGTGRKQGRPACWRAIPRARRQAAAACGSSAAHGDKARAHVGYTSSTGTEKNRLVPADLARPGRVGTCRSRSTASRRCERPPAAGRKSCGYKKTGLWPVDLARPEGFEPPTPKFVAWCSIQLSYGRVAKKRNYEEPTDVRQSSRWNWRRLRDSNPRWSF